MATRCALRRATAPLARCCAEPLRRQPIRLPDALRVLPRAGRVHRARAALGHHVRSRHARRHDLDRRRRRPALPPRSARLRHDPARVVHQDAPARGRGGEPLREPRHAPRALGARHAPVATRHAPVATRHAPVATRHAPVATRVARPARGAPRATRPRQRPARVVRHHHGVSPSAHKRAALARSTAPRLLCPMCG